MQTYQSTDRPYHERRQLKRPPSGALMPRISPLRLGLWAAVLVAVLALALAASPALEYAAAQTVPEPDPLPTVLVGPIDEIGDELWTVAGVPITVTEDTRINERVGVVQEGAWARVTGAPDGEGTIVAARIKVLPPRPFIKMWGTLDELTADSLTVDGVVFSRTVTTMVVGDPAAGNRVKVRASIESTGNRLALQVVNQAGAGGDDDVEDPGAQEIVLIGEVIQMPEGGNEGRWSISGFPVDVSGDTAIERRVGPLVPGAWVKVTGAKNEQGAIGAATLTTRPTARYHSITGKLTSLDSQTVVVEGFSIDLAERVTVRGTPAPGEQVAVFGLLRADRSLLAMKIIAQEDAEPEDGVLKIRFDAVIDKLPEEGLVGTWVFSGRDVDVVAGTIIDEHKGRVEEGARAAVEALLARDGTITALEIVVKPSRPDDEPDGRYVEFTGFVEELPGVNAATDGHPPADNLIGPWRISGKTVMVTGRTRIDLKDDRIREGAKVKVKGIRLNDRIFARSIKVLENADSREMRFVGAIVSRPDNLIGEWTISAADVDGHEDADDHSGDDDEEDNLIYGAGLFHDGEDEPTYSYTVLTTGETRFQDRNGPFDQGALVEVEGYWQGDVIVATKMTTKPLPEVYFVGRVSEFPAGLVGPWTIDERAVTANEETRFRQEKGPFAEGGLVRVWGYKRVDGSILARKIETLPPPSFEFTGEVKRFPPGLIGEWEVGDKTVQATGETEFKQRYGSFAEGVLVEVEAVQMGDSQYLAEEIKTLPLPEIEFYGEIVDFPPGLIGDWEVGEWEVVTTNRTNFIQRNGEFSSGVYVAVKGVVQPDGKVRAGHIKTVR